MISRNRLLRVVALPAFEELPAQVVYYVRKYGERWYVRVSPASEQRLARIVREWRDVKVDADERGVAVTVFVDPEQKMLAGGRIGCRWRWMCMRGGIDAVSNARIRISKTRPGTQSECRATSVASHGGTRRDSPGR